MKYIKTFNEDSNTDYVSVIKSLVDWDLINFISDKLIRYEDSGYLFSVDLCFYDNLKDVLSYGAYYAIAYGICGGLGNTTYESAYINVLKNKFKTGNLVFEVELYSTDGETARIDIMEFKDEIVSLLSPKLDFIAVVKYSHYKTALFTLKK